MRPAEATATSPTHNTTDPVRTTTATFDWTAAPGSDATSGIAGYSWSSTANAGDLPDTSVDTTPTKISTTFADGTNYFHLAAVDRAGNVSTTTTYGPVRIDQNAPPVADIARDRFVGLWHPRTLSETFYKDWFANPIPPAIHAEGFHGLDEELKRYLADALWAAVIAGKASDLGLDPAGRSAMFAFVFDEDTAARPANTSHYPASELEQREEGTDPITPEPAQLKDLIAGRLTGLVLALAPVIAVVDVPDEVVRRASALAQGYREPMLSEPPAGLTLAPRPTVADTAPYPPFS